MQQNMAQKPVSKTALRHLGPIDGTIGFGGTFAPNGGAIGNLFNASSLVIQTGIIFNALGAYAGAANLTVASPIPVNANLPALVGTTLWTVQVGTTTYKFVVASVSELFLNLNFMSLGGAGHVSNGNLALATPGNWALVFFASTATYSGSTATSLPPAVFHQ
jgi:hypothetical protein